ncbi:MAG: phenylalanine--tRNA ligase subunit beta [Acidaminobacteraceae bacterium]
MLAPIKWLKDYVNIDGIDINEIKDKFIMTGSNIETVEQVAEKIEKIIVGKIVKKEAHPDADKLVILQIDVAEDELVQIVTGATNVEVSNLVPVVMVNGRIADGTKIKKGKLRGVPSFGMLCSLDELGYDVKVVQKSMADGIFILGEEYTIGEEIKQAIPEMDDHIIEFEITPNRPDCLSLIGLAREAAATFNRGLTLPIITIKNEVEDVNTYASIQIEDTDLCPRIAAKVVKDVVIKDSPDWMKMKLMHAGMRPINNIVDITNFVMLEFGQPIHAYDLDKLKGNKIIARRARENEIITTLDDVERKLTREMLVITDSERTVGIAGIMGGEDTEVKDSTTKLLIEVANFNKTNIRKTSKTLGLRSEASSRFEKGVSAAYCDLVANRVCQLIEELDAGVVVGGLLDIYPAPLENKVIEARVGKINSLIGINLSSEEMATIFEKLGLSTEIKGDMITVIVPHYRLDLEKEIDLVEEVARIYGYDEIGATLPMGAEWGAKTNGQQIEDITKDILVSLGLNEIVTYSFVSPKQLDMIRTDENSILRQQIKLLNPLGEEYSIMRTTLLPNLLEVIARNNNRKVESVRAFEIGNLFIPKELPVTTLPIEKKSLVIGRYGVGEDFFSMKGAVEELLDKLGIKGYEFIPEANHPTYHPGRCANIQWENHILGTIGEIHPKVIENYDINTRVYASEIDYNIILQLVKLDRIYKALPKYPAMTRDMALLVKDEVTNGEIISIINNNGGKILESSSLFDVYRGKQIESGYKSMAYSLTFRASDRTLTDEEVTKVYDKILVKLEEVDVKLR